MLSYSQYLWAKALGGFQREKAGPWHERYGMTDVYVLIATAVYDQGVYGVFITEQEAVDHAEALLDESDYHHTFRVDRRTIGVGMPSDKKLGEVSHRHKPGSRWALERPTVMRGKQPRQPWEDGEYSHE
jgi:hypothetical protein